MRIIYKVKDVLGMSRAMGGVAGGGGVDAR